MKTFPKTHTLWWYQRIQNISDFLKEICLKLEIRGKIRIASEGFNITIGGSFKAVVEFTSVLLKEKGHLFRGIEKLIQKNLDGEIDTSIRNGLECTSSKEAGLCLSPLGKFAYYYFKPSEGCQHVFDKLSVTVLRDGRLFEGIRSDLLSIPCTSEQIGNAIYQQTLCKNLEPKVVDKKEKVVSLPPDKFHQQLLCELKDSTNANSALLLDCRNYYEMKIGHFKGAILPPIRKYSLLPKYIEKNKDLFRGKKIFTYCTGGIRCETAAPLICSQTDASQVFMLQGGIHNYLDYVSSHNIESLFTGVNYVFDARQSLGSSPSLCSTCSECYTPCITYTKCHCHAIIILCKECKVKGVNVYCCEDCGNGKRPCLCERERASKLGIGLWTNPNISIKYTSNVW